MVVYNITTKVHASVDTAWLRWQQQEQIPVTMATGLFITYKIFRLLEQDDSDGNTYAIQYTALTEEQYGQYLIIHAPLQQQAALEKWGDSTISFHSVLEVIH